MQKGTHFIYSVPIATELRVACATSMECLSLSVVLNGAIDLLFSGGKAIVGQIHQSFM
jgi:hypothetical protein